MTRKGTTRREAMRYAAALVGLGAGKMLAAGDAGGGGGFRIGGTDWELKGPNDPGAFAVAARLGFDGIQVDLGDVVAMKDPARQAEFRKVAAEHKVEIASLAMGMFYQVSVAEDKRAPELLDAGLSIAAAMGQKVLLVACFGKSDLMQQGPFLDALVGRMKEHAKRAEATGVVIGLEAECSVEHYRKVLDRIGSPAVKAYFDTAHAHVPGRDIAEEIKSLKDHVCEFHAKDLAAPLLGSGKIDFPAVRRGLDAIGYRGWIHLEQWAEVPGDKPLGFDETHRRNLSYLRGIFPKQVA